MPSNADLAARLDTIAAQMPRFREDFERVFADTGDRTDPPHPAMKAAPDAQRQPDRNGRSGATVERATRH